MLRDPTSPADDDWFFASLESRGDAIAIITEDGREISYRTLAEAADAAAPAGATLAALEFSSRYDALIAYLGALRSGVPIILLAPGAIAKDRRIVDLFAPDAVFEAEAGRWQPMSGGGVAPHPDLAILLSTSGSTGDPKLVRLSRTAVAANAASIREYLGLTAADRAITSLPLSYSFGLSVLHSHLAAGGSIALTGDSVATDAFWDRFVSAGCTVFAGVPHSYQLLERSGFFTRDTGQLRLLQQAGGRMDAAAVRRWTGWADEAGKRFFVMYGQTEATARMAWLPPELAAAHPDCIGQAIPGGAFTLEDADGTAIEGAGTPGELVYSGPNVMMGYARTAADLALSGSDPVLRTGDIAERNEAGLFRIVGRVARFVKLFGLRIGLDDMEKGLVEDGLDAAVTGDDQRLIVAVDGTVDMLALRGRIAARYGLPESCILITADGPLPRRDNGKPDYAAILALASDAGSTGGKGTALHRFYVTIARGRAVSPEDSFASLGGDSLAYVQATMEIEAALGDVPDRWEEMSLAELEALAAARGRDTGQRSRFTRLDTEMLLRAAAITAIVMLHSHLARIAGGAELLIFLAGFNLLRFQRARLVGGRALMIARSFFLNFMLPYLALLLLYSALKQEVDPASYLLVSNYVGRFHSVLEPYWFMEALFQCILLITLVFSVPTIARAARGHTLRVVLILLALAVVARLFSLVFEPAMLKNRTAESVLFLYAGGMAFALAARPLRLAIAALLIGLSMAAWGILDTHPMWLILAFAGLIFVPGLYVPRAFATVIRHLAAASFYIYMVHSMVIWLLVYRHGVDERVISTLASLALGWLCWRGHVAWQKRSGRGGSGDPNFG